MHAEFWSINLKERDYFEDLEDIKKTGRVGVG
jgi:hypothetical protein